MAIENDAAAHARETPGPRARFASWWGVPARQAARLGGKLDPAPGSRAVVACGAAAALAVGLLASGNLAGMSADQASPSDTTGPARMPAGMRWADEPALPMHVVATPLMHMAAASPASAASVPEARLMAVYKLAAEGRLDDAQAAAERLTADLPQFRLAQLALADLIAARVRLPASFGEGGATDAERAALQALHDEAIQRVRAQRDVPPAGAVPAEFVALPQTEPFAIAVDTSRGRLYLFENGPQGLKLRENLYVSIGKQGVDKLTEGDQKTPLGVYFVNEHIAPQMLEKRFGVGALWLNYPNAYDKLRGRTGNGIMLHGVAAGTYARPPQDSDGCIAIPNEDLQRIQTQLPARQTPVVIARNIHWVKPGAQSVPGNFERAFKQWQAARTLSDADALAASYMDPSLRNRPNRLRSRLATPVDGYDDVSLLTWTRADDMIVATFDERSADAPDTHKRYRQYWSRDGDDWRIVVEGQVR